MYLHRERWGPAVGALEGGAHGLDAPDALERVVDPVT